MQFQLVSELWNKKQTFRTCNQCYLVHVNYFNNYYYFILVVLCPLCFPLKTYYSVCSHVIPPIQSAKKLSDQR